MTTDTPIAGSDIIIAARRMNSGCIMAGPIISCANASWGIVAKRLADAYHPKLARWHKVLNRGYSQRHEVLRMRSQGKKNPEAAKEMGVSVETVRTYLKRAMKKLGARDVTGAVPGQCARICYRGHGIDRNFRARWRCPQPDQANSAAHFRHSQAGQTARRHRGKPCGGGGGYREAPSLRVA